VGNPPRYELGLVNLVNYIIKNKGTYHERN